MTSRYSTAGNGDSNSNSNGNGNGNGNGDPPNVIMVPLDKVVSDPDQPRKNVTRRSLLLLAENISCHGLLTPIHLRPPRDDGMYEIVAGHRRVHAVRKLGWSEIAAIIRWEDERDLILIQGAENLAREQLRPLEILALIERLVGLGFTRAEIVVGLGVHRMTVNRYARVSAHAAAREALLGGASLRYAVAMTTAGRGGEVMASDASTLEDSLPVAGGALPDTGADVDQDQVIPASASSGDARSRTESLRPFVMAGDEARHDHLEATATRAWSLDDCSGDGASADGHENVPSAPVSRHSRGLPEAASVVDTDVDRLSVDEIREIEQIQKEHACDGQQAHDQLLDDPTTTAVRDLLAAVDREVQLVCNLLAKLPDRAFATSLNAAYRQLGHLKFERDELDEL